MACTHYMPVSSLATYSRARHRPPTSLHHIIPAGRRPRQDERGRWLKEDAAGTPPETNQPRLSGSIAY